MLLHQLLLRRAVLGQTRPAQADLHQTVLLAFIDSIGPYLLTEYAAIPALGGSPHAVGLHDDHLPPGLVFLDATQRARFSKGHDQSLATHILNGIFAGLGMAKHIPPAKQFDQEALQVWLLAFVVHDYTKVYGIDMPASKLDAIRQLIMRLGITLHFSDFIADWQSYLDDIVFLAQNIQKSKGANLSPADYPNCRLAWRRLEDLRMLGSYADVLVHITGPADVSERDARGRDTARNLNFTLTSLCGLGKAPRLAYHKLTEVRGLLSNVVNTAIMEELQAQGYVPYLFFPDGVVYIVTGDTASLDLDQIIARLWDRIGLMLLGGTPANADDDDDDLDAEMEGSGGLQIKRTKDYMKVQPILYEILTLPKLLAAGRDAALRIKNPLTGERIGSEVVEQAGILQGKLPLKDKKALFAEHGRQYAEQEKLPTDVRADQLAEFLGFVQRRVLKEFFPKAEWTTSILLAALELGDILPARAEAQRSGTPTGWFYVAARYLQKQPGTTPDELVAVMDRVITHVLDYLQQHSLAVPTPDTLAIAFRSYLAGILVLDGQPIGRDVAEQIGQFASELTAYTERKAKNKEVCTLCSSPYPCAPQDISVVLFKGQQYSNKAKLDTSKVIRGICPICSIEMMLRQVQQEMPAKTAQDEKPIAVYLYPTYFFTAETAYVIKLFIQRLRDLSLLGLIYKHLEPQGFQAADVLSYEHYTFEDYHASDIERKTFSVKKPQYGDSDPAGLFFFSLRPPMKNPTDTDSWIVPTFYALALPLLLNVKVVVSSSFVPLYRTGADFRETALLDAPHPFTAYVLPSDRLRVDELPVALIRLLRLYQLHLDVFADKGDMHWPLINAIAKDVATDPYFVFSYYDRRERKPKDKDSKAKKGQSSASGSGKGIAPWDLVRYRAIYQALGGAENMGFIGELVDKYAAFYRADNLDAAHSVLRPLMTAIEVVVESSPSTDHDDLLLLVAGALNDDQERVRGDAETKGYDPIVYNRSLGDYGERLRLSRQAIETFAALFIQKAFIEYCKGDRGILRERTNRLRSAARFHYLQQHGPKGKTAISEA